MRVPLLVSALALALPGVLTATSPARAGGAHDVTHVVQRGETLQTIARRYKVTAQSVAEANHKKVGDALKPGESLLVPHATPPPRPHLPFERDVVHAVRLDEPFRIRVKDAHGKVPEASLKAFERMMRQGGATHPPDPRLVAMIGVVSNHFEGRTLEVVSGYRAYTPTQYTPDSRHNYGRALDFRIQGIRNEELRDFCRTLRNTGCGYYPNSTFVHLDVRNASAYWVDLARPGEPPHYERPAALADEGASDVTTESH
jgi:uncharacterized protein YcbK (DUF882 family)